MPVKVVVDATDATASELQAFQTSVGAQIAAVGQAAAQQGFQFEHRIVPDPGGPITQADVYKETMQTIRYHGTVRYLLLPVYLTAIGTLAGLLYKTDPAVPHHQLIVAGLLLSFVFGVFEIGLSNNLRILWAEVVKMAAAVFPATANIDPFPHRKPWQWLAFVRGVLFLPYLAGLVFWICRAVDWRACCFLQ